MFNYDNPNAVPPKPISVNSWVAPGAAKPPSPYGPTGPFIPPQEAPPVDNGGFDPKDPGPYGPTGPFIPDNGDGLGDKFPGNTGPMKPGTPGGPPLPPEREQRTPVKSMSPHQRHLQHVAHMNTLSRAAARRRAGKPTGAQFRQLPEKRGGNSIMLPGT